jgi:resuscitation-promoting factor RpfB
MRILRTVSIAMLLVLIACDSPGPDLVLADPTAPVPDVVGFARGTALESLRTEGFVPVVRRKWTAYASQGEVIRQKPEGGVVLESGASVVVVVARELREVPDVEGMRTRRARRVLRRAGFLVRVITRRGGPFDTFDQPGTILRTFPGAYATRRPGTAITVVVKAPSPPRDPTTSGCHSSYSGCVPVASDVDCAGGSGDGPAYVSGPVYIQGSDPYGLDRDGDGVACES